MTRARAGKIKGQTLSIARRFIAEQHAYLPVVRGARMQTGHPSGPGRKCWRNGKKVGRNGIESVGKSQKSSDIAGAPPPVSEAVSDSEEESAERCTRRAMGGQGVQTARSAPKVREMQGTPARGRVADVHKVCGSGRVLTHATAKSVGRGGSPPAPSLIARTTSTVPKGHEGVTAIITVPLRTKCLPTRRRTGDVPRNCSSTEGGKKSAGGLVHSSKTMLRRMARGAEAALMTCLR